MIDITYKRPSLRRAVAEATVRCCAETRDIIKNKKVPKGDVFEMSRAAGLLAIKNTPHLLPFCHPIPVEYADITFELTDEGVKVRVEAECIFRTGIEVETMTAASITALNLYDMLKPIDSDTSIEHIHVVEKSGGKGDFGKIDRTVQASVILCGGKKSTAGDIAKEMLEWHDIKVVSYSKVSSDIEKISKQVISDCEAGVDFVFTVGGTGLGSDDVTVEAVTDLLDRETPGIIEAMRSHGLERTPYAALSRSIAGQRGSSLILTLPGSTQGVKESIEALFPWVLRVSKVLDHSS